MNSGVRMVRGALLGRGIFVQRERVRQSLHRVDPISLSLRRHVAIQRRQYFVSGPNALWLVKPNACIIHMFHNNELIYINFRHIDGHHKLIRWKLVIHGGEGSFTEII